MTLIHVPNQGKSRAEQKLFDMNCEMCIIFCSLFAYIHGHSIIKRRRWTSRRRELYKINEHREKRCGWCDKEINKLWKTVKIIRFCDYWIFSNKQTQIALYLTCNQMSPSAMIDHLIFTVFAVISHKIHESLQITEHEHPLMH